MSVIAETRIDMGREATWPEAYHGTRSGLLRIGLKWDLDAGAAAAAAVDRLRILGGPILMLLSSGRRSAAGHVRPRDSNDVVAKRERRCLMLRYFNFRCKISHCVGMEIQRIDNRPSDRKRDEATTR